MVGKRRRPPMKRTTSMMGLSSDLDNHHHHHPRPSDRDGGFFHPPRERQRLEAQTPPSEGVMGHGDVGNGCDGRRPQRPRWTSSSPDGKGGHGYVSGPVSPEFFPVVTASFLKACGLCKRSLGPGKDTFMYRGEIAFCSLECRQQQMAIDERKEKCSFASIKNNPSQATARSKPSGGCETAAA